MILFLVLFSFALQLGDYNNTAVGSYDYHLGKYQLNPFFLMLSMECDAQSFGPE